MPTDTRKFYQRGQYLHGAAHSAMPHGYTRGMFVKGAPVGGVCFLKKRKTPTANLAEIEARVAQARIRLAEITAMVRNK